MRARLMQSAGLKLLARWIFHIETKRSACRETFLGMVARTKLTMLSSATVFPAVQSNKVDLLQEC